MLHFCSTVYKFQGGANCRTATWGPRFEVDYIDPSCRTYPNKCNTHFLRLHLKQLLITVQNHEIAYPCRGCVRKYSGYTLLPKLLANNFEISTLVVWETVRWSTKRRSSARLFFEQALAPRWSWTLKHDHLGQRIDIDPRLRFRLEVNTLKSMVDVLSLEWSREQLDALCRHRLDAIPRMSMPCTQYQPNGDFQVCSL